jgi:hypothetical protein
MVLPPSHLHDYSFFCQDAEDSLPFPSRESIDLKKSEMENEFRLEPQEHEELCWNLQRNRKKVPWKLKDLAKMYEEEKQKLSEAIETKLQYQERKYKQYQSNTNKSKRDIRLERQWKRLCIVREAARNATGEFFAQWKPFLQAYMRCSVSLKAWSEGLEQYQMEVTQELNTWKKLNKKQPEKKCTLSITYREGQKKQRHIFSVTNQISIEELASQVQQAMGIVLFPEEDLCFFCVSGPLKSGTTLDQYTDKIKNLSVFKISKKTSAGQED